MSARRPLIAGNWKMNGRKADGLALVRALADWLAGEGAAHRDRFDMLVCPPATLIAPVIDALGGAPLDVGGQDCHAAENGAHTGDISAWMLKDLGATHVIVGHSERRTDHHEDDEQVRAKAAAALAAGLVPIICIGETEAERDAGQALAIVARQLNGSLPEGATGTNVVIAYEPVWAIGTGRTPTAQDVAEVHQRIRAEARGRIGDGADALRILYGGSVKPGNAAELMAIEDVDGALVGGASLKAADFQAIALGCP
ncbi:triose-phosphate isomerase [Roseospira marina]|uniref:Triosephosphate isomerase n=1 Tax=Roseospira marina TaxID=140057 RepID=A0A5M6IGS1_9PROT|nr:triose-phosphate isomerase [Roseospira marina]KAA5607097.1 triose-phosphate isomerase [Roseospira marina]MBB4312710.1 triosephosphate isomerase [Roseospira marina]MBB5086517.1 triosephosphate isomerase [Roseospira marina]